MLFVQLLLEQGSIVQQQVDNIQLFPVLIASELVRSFSLVRSIYILIYEVETALLSCKRTAKPLFLNPIFFHSSCPAGPLIFYSSPIHLPLILGLSSTAKPPSKPQPFQHMQQLTVAVLIIAG